MQPGRLIGDGMGHEGQHGGHQGTAAGAAWMPAQDVAHAGEFDGVGIDMPGLEPAAQLRRVRLGLMPEALAILAGGEGAPGLSRRGWGVTARGEGRPP